MRAPVTPCGLLTFGDFCLPAQLADSTEGAGLERNGSGALDSGNDGYKDRGQHAMSGEEGASGCGASRSKRSAG